MNNRKISAAFTALPEGLVKNCVVEVNGKGEIISVERNVENLDSCAGVEYFNGILSAGFVNCHCHLEYSYVKGMISPGGGLGKFISNIIDIKYNRPIAENDKIEMAAKYDKVMFQNGISAVGDHNNNDYVTDIKRNSDIYYHTFVELYDADNQDSESTFYDGVKRAAMQRELGLTTSVVPHATYTLADDLVAMIGGEKETSKGDINGGILSTHFLESVKLGGENEVDRMIGAINNQHDSVLLIHSIYAKKEDIEKAKNKFGDKLTVAPCPLSNLFIEERLADYKMLIESGVRIAFGTDGLSSNEKLSIIDEMRCVQDNYSDIKIDTLLKWATLNGAEALCINSWAGSIEIGKRPGLVILEDIDLQTMKITSESSVTRLV